MIELGKELISRSNKKIFLSKDEKYLVKVFNNKLVGKADVLAEALNQARVEQTNLVCIPSLKEVFTINYDWCIAYEFIKGKTMQELIDSNKANEKKYIDKMIDLQISVQKITVENLPGLTNKLQQRISLSKSFIDATTRYELHMRLDAMPKHTKLCHCDFNPTNIIYGDDGKVYITDWAHAGKGNASADVAYTYMFFMLKNRPDLAKYYLDGFCTKTDTAIQYVQRYMPIIAAAMAYKSSGEEKKFLLSQTEVVEYE